MLVDVETGPREVSASKYYTVVEYAELLRCSPGFVYRAIRSGKLKALRIGRLVRIPM